MKLSEIKLNPDNPRQISEEKFEKLKKSLKEFPKMMALRPLVIDKDNMVLGGNMRLRALLENGLTEIPDNWVKRADELTDEEKKRFIVADNVPFGEWDFDSLANNFEIEDLLNWGFDEKDLKIETEVEEDEVPEVQEEAVSKLGDLYQIGSHRLLCGDATKIEDVERLMDGQKADMVFTDPPYGMSLDTDYSVMVGFKGKVGNKFEKVKGDNEDFIPELITSVLDNFSYCKEIFMFGGDYYIDILPNFGKDGSWVVWDKQSDENEIGIGVNDSYEKMFGSNFELCWSKTKHKRVLCRVLWKGMFGMGKEDEKKRIHPTQKPIGVCSWFIKRFSKNENNIVDLFGGSGSTLIACEQLNRKCYMMEIDPRYIDVIIKRWENFTGNKAVKL